MTRFEAIFQIVGTVRFRRESVTPSIHLLTLRPRYVYRGRVSSSYLACGLRHVSKVGEIGSAVYLVVDSRAVSSYTCREMCTLQVGER